MLRRTPLRLSAATLSVLVAGIAAGPALAASEVAKGTATAARITVAGTPTDSGTYTASNDGTKETTSGNSKPAITVLGGQQLISEGTLAQLAKTTIKGKKVDSAACAGLAGQGATVAAVGDATCLSGGQTLALNEGKLDFSNLTLTDSDLETALTAALPAGTDLTLLTGPLGTALATAIRALGSPSVDFNAGALQASCQAVPRSANGTANLADASFSATLPNGGQTVSLLDLPVNPAPNTPVTSSPTLLVNAISASLNKSLTGAGLPALIDAAAITAVVKQATDQLETSGALDMLVKGTLNKQSRPSSSSIDVTALDLRVLPGAAMGSDALRLEVGDVTCSAGTVAAATTTTTTTAVPTSIDAGRSGDQPSSPVLPVVGGLMLLGAAGIGVRRLVDARG